MVLSGGLHEASGVGMPGLSPCKVCDRGWVSSRLTQDLGGHDLLWEGSLQKESEGERERAQCCGLSVHVPNSRFISEILPSKIVVGCGARELPIPSPCEDTVRRCGP